MFTYDAMWVFLIVLFVEAFVCWMVAIASPFQRAAFNKIVYDVAFGSFVLASVLSLVMVAVMLSDRFSA